MFLIKSKEHTDKNCIPNACCQISKPAPFFLTLFFNNIKIMKENLKEVHLR